MGRGRGGGRGDGELRLGRRGHVVAEIGIREERGDRSQTQPYPLGSGRAQRVAFPRLVVIIRREAAGVGGGG